MLYPKDAFTPEHLEYTEELYHRGVFLYGLGKYADAIRNFDKAIENCEKVNDERNLALSLYNKGYSLGNLEEYEKSINCFNEAIERYYKIKESNNHYFFDIADAWRNKGYAIAMMDYKDNHKDADDCLNRA
ncbi:MAG TPA: tetratricopeptide repeat protein, partial [Nitrososphaeraceae archaeon]|nr:tetratricopeptide repeat protein [Nitrososphaeraceae archaeon]